MRNFITNRLKSIVYAFKGAFLLIKTEASIKVQVATAIAMILAGFYFNISTTEWIMQIFAFGLVLSIEGINTAIEKICDFIHPDKHEKIGEIKDISAGAVMLSAITAAIIGLIIYVPKIF